MSFRAQLVMGAIATLAAIECSQDVREIATEWHRLEERLLIRSQLATDLLSQSVVLPMWDFNSPVVTQMISGVSVDPTVARARLEARLPAGLIAPHFTVLNHLVRVHDGTTPQRMARAFQVPKTSLTHTLKGLESRGLVEVRPNPEDGRSKTVWITKAGRALRGRVIGELAPEFRHLMGEFGIDRLLAVKPVLADLRRYLDENREEG